MEDQARIIGRLVDLLIKGDLSEEDNDRIRLWLADDRNRDMKDAALEKLFFSSVHEEYPDQSAYDGLKLLLEKIDGANVYARPDLKKSPKRQRMVFRVAAVVAGLVVLAGTAIWLGRGLSRDGRESDYITVSTSDGQTKELTLPCGSKVSLAAGSSLSYRDGRRAERTVALTGEARFDVKRLAGKPFLVTTQNIKVTVLGTVFDLKDFNDGLSSVALLSGQVRVDMDDRHVVLSPNEMLLYDYVNKTMEIANCDEAQAGAGAAGELELDGTPLPQAVRMVGEFFGKQVEITGHLPHDIEVTTIFDSNISLEDALEVLILMSDSFDYHLDDDTLVITGRGTRGSD